MEDIEATNGLTSDFLNAGQMHILNNEDNSMGPKTIIVVAGDTLWQLSRTHSVSIDAIKKANGLTSNDIEAGSSLIIPSNNTNTGDLTSLNTKDISNQMVRPNTHDQSSSSSTRDSLSFTKNVLSKIDESVILRYKEETVGRSALAEAANRGLYDCCEVIYNRCPKLLWETDVYESSALNDAASGGYVDIVKFLIGKDEGQKLLMGRNKFKYTALHHAANAGQLGAVKALVAADETHEVLKARNDAGNTPLHLAVKESRLEVVEYLAGVDTNYVYPSNLDGHTPLFMAWNAAFSHPTQLTHATIRTALVRLHHEQCQLQGNPSKKTLLHYAAENGDMTAFDEIILHSRGCMSMVDINGKNCVHTSAQYKQEHMINNIVDSNEIPKDVLNALDNNGRTPLHIATSTGDEGVILPLL